MITTDSENGIICTQQSRWCVNGAASDIKPMTRDAAIYGPWVLARTGKRMKVATNVLIVDPNRRRGGDPNDLRELV